MALKLMYITNKPEVAQIAEESGVDWIFVDLEIIGKEKRQGHLDTVISKHNIGDVKKVKSKLKKSELLVRVNPIHENSKEEIDKVIQDGADIVMLPYFKKKQEVVDFIKFVDDRAKKCLLVETAAAAMDIDSILEVEGIDYIHIGLNDLHIEYGMKFMFELLCDGTVENLCNKINKKGIPYGFGGIAQLGKGILPSDNIIPEHYRLGSSMVILSRSFCDLNNIEDLEEIRYLFQVGVRRIREYENIIYNKFEDYYEDNKKIIMQKVKDIVGERSEEVC